MQPTAFDLSKSTRYTRMRRRQVANPVFTQLVDISHAHLLMDVNLATITLVIPPNKHSTDARVRIQGRDTDITIGAEAYARLKNELTWYRQYQANAQGTEVPEIDFMGYFENDPSRVTRMTVITAHIGYVAYYGSDCHINFIGCKHGCVARTDDVEVIMRQFRIPDLP